MMKILNKLFGQYEEDDHAPYIHSGVGYNGVNYEYTGNKPARSKHHGVGYGGKYE